MAEGYGVLCQTCGWAGTSFAKNREHVSRQTAGRAANFATYIVNNPLIRHHDPCYYLAYNVADIFRHH